MNEPLIDPNRVEEVYRACLFTNEELPPGSIDFTAPEEVIRRKLPEHVYVDGIRGGTAFHPGRLEEHKAEIAEMLSNLPDTFQRDGGGGWSFLNACQDKNDVQWTGLHLRMDQLFQLGMAVGLADLVLSRELWHALPGGMPYYVVGEKKEATA